MVNYNLNQPSLPEIQEKIAVAKRARELGRLLRQGKSLGFRPAIGNHPNNVHGFRPPFDQLGARRHG